jgi:hypothetical protein
MNATLERLKNFFIKFFTKVGNVFQFISHVFSLFSQLFVTAFLIYAVLTKPADRIVNGILLALAVGYFIFGVYIALDGYSQKDRKIKQHVARSYKIVKRLFKVYTLGVAVYGIYQHMNASPDMQTIASLIFTALMVISFAVQVTLEIHVFIIRLLLKKLIKNRKEKRAQAKALKDSQNAPQPQMETDMETTSEPNVEETETVEIVPTANETVAVAHETQTEEA